MPTADTLTRVRVDGPGWSGPALLARPGPTGRPVRAVLAFGHGFLQRPWRYAGLLHGLAELGCLTVAPDTQTGPLPRHTRLAVELTATLDWARQQAGGSCAAYTIGHSMGAGAALLALTRDERVDGAVLLSGLDTRPSMLAAMPRVTRPTLHVVGTDDTVVPPERSRQLYAAVPQSATWREIEGGGHCGVLDRAFPKERLCGASRISPATQLRATLDAVDAWLNVPDHPEA